MKTGRKTSDAPRRWRGPGVLPAPLLLLLVVGAACGSKDDGPVDPSDGGLDAPIDATADGGAGQDVPASVAAVDFTMQGCTDFDPSGPTCRGPAPLTISFIPITSGNVSRLLWDFGDSSAPSSDPLPGHTYPLPGSYTVTLTGAPGQVWKRHPDLIVVTPNPFGEACDLERQCADGLSCLCGLSTGCPAAFARGMCTQPCTADGQSCPEGGVCADLGEGAITRGTPDDNPWRDRHCLRSCGPAGECPAGQRCRLVPGASLTQPWQMACFHGYPADLGEGCRSASGAPQNELCLGGLCADLGALGSCSLDCSARACPEGLACAAFNDGRRLCLRPCTGASSCLADPLLACGLPGGLGPAGFSVTGAPPGRTFCAPKPCSTDSGCQPAGVCRGDPGAAHCTRG